MMSSDTKSGLFPPSKYKTLHNMQAFAKQTCQSCYGDSTTTHNDKKTGIFKNSQTLGIVFVSFP